jgi:hypothetical protein
MHNAPTNAAAAQVKGDENGPARHRVAARALGLTLLEWRMAGSFLVHDPPKVAQRTRARQ